jgi:hypothetical protein
MFKTSVWILAPSFKDEKALSVRRKQLLVRSPCIIIQNSLKDFEDWSKQQMRQTLYYMHKWNNQNFSLSKVIWGTSASAKAHQLNAN